MTAFEAGKVAKQTGASVESNPHCTGFTKLGAMKLTDEGLEWERGFYSVARIATKKEIADAELMDISKFRRKSNRYYA
jgi:hypothetical protein